jgi:hypothetical protein
MSECDHTIDLDDSFQISALTTAQIPSLSSITGPFNSGLGASGNAATYLGASGSNGTYSITTNGNGNSMWTTSPYQTNSNVFGTISNGGTPSIKVSGDAEFEGKVMINGQDLAQFMETMSKRLSILVPDPKKLEHFKALQKAYDHYKTLEALCQLPENADDK